MIKIAASIEEIFGGEEYFECERLHIRMKKESCVQSQIRRPECRDCDKGLEIGRELTKRINEKLKGEETMPETKICKKCRQAKLLDDFSTHPECKDGHIGTCKQCRNDEAKERRHAKEKGEASGSKKLVLDITKWPGIQEGLQKAAKEQIRTFEYQAIAYIVKGLKEDGYGSDHAGD